MAGRLSVDTTFLIDLQRERTRGVHGPAHSVLADDPEMELCLSTVALGEFAEGFEDPNHPVLRAVQDLHVLLSIDEGTALTYGHLTRELCGRSQLLGANDLWIASTSLRHRLPLLTADVASFRRISGLELVPYR